VAVAALIHGRSAARERAIGGQLPLRLAAPDGGEWVVAVEDESHAVRIAEREGGADVILEDGRTVAVASGWRPGAPIFTGAVDGRPVTIQIDRLADGYRLSHAGVEARVAVRTRRAQEL